MIRRTPGKSAVWKDGKLTIFPLSKVIEPGFHGDKPSNCQPRTYPFGKGIGTSGDFPEKKAYEAYRREKPLLLKEWQITDIELANSKLRREKIKKNHPKKSPPQMAMKETAETVR